MYYSVFNRRCGRFHAGHVSLLSQRIAVLQVQCEPVHSSRTQINFVISGRSVVLEDLAYEDNTFTLAKSLCLSRTDSRTANLFHVSC